jgi:DNA modification methylase
MHLAGKPVDVMRAIVRICEPGGVVLDPFAGSGSTGIACLRQRLRFVGVEMTEVYATMAQRRLEAEAPQPVRALASVTPLRPGTRKKPLPLRPPAPAADAALAEAMPEAA